MEASLPMPETLNEVERRVLGVLLEKQLAQPQYYPMTVNAVVAACNQKSNRDPVMDLDEDLVWATLEALRTRQIISRLLPGGSSRVERFKHEIKELWGWEKPQRAIMAELLLRGPQTTGELRSRCQRMYPFEDAQMLGGALEVLTSTEPPTVVQVPRAPGQSAVRYAHQLYYPEEWNALTQASAAGAASAPAPPSVAASAPPPAADTDLASELATLKAELAALAARVSELERKASP
jgi:uncharacterized protein YceH (UPF0502 family)